MVTGALTSATATDTKSAAPSLRDLCGPVAVLMPVRDDTAALANTLASLRAGAPRFGAVWVFVVDDGSEPKVPLDELPGASPAFSLTLARHVVNLGQGAALETARQLALAAPVAFQAFVTMDADGQHRAEDAHAVACAVEDGADVAFGNRFLGRSAVPTGRRVLLFLATVFERLLTGLALTDAHNGLRAFRRAALERVTIRQNRMAHATEIKLRVSRAGMHVVEVPVCVRYTRESLAKGQRASGAALILRDLVLAYLFGEEPS